MGKFTNKTVDGAKRLFALLVVLILLFSFLAHMFATNFGRVKIEQINIDARGALLDGELYYPVGTSDESSLPAVIVTHGAGCTHKGMNSYCIELARALANFPSAMRLVRVSRTTTRGIRRAVCMMRWSLCVR